jgi:hypothetical protein
MKNNSRKSVLAAVFVILTAGVIFFFLTKSSDTQAVEYQVYNTSQPDTLQLDVLAPEEIIFLLGQASVLENDSLKESRFRAFLIQTKVSGFIQEKLDRGQLDRNEANIDFIIQFLNKNGYGVMPAPPSAFAKLIHYISTGNFIHIWNRIVGRDYHLYFITLVFIFSFLIIFRKPNFKIMKKITALFIFFLLLGITGYAQRTEQIPFEKEQNGMMYFDATINGIQETFLFDTGASGIVLNPVFFGQLKNQGLISQADYLGNTDVVGINNITVNVAMYNIKSLSVGSFKMYDLLAFLMPDSNAQLIIGQSMFEKLGKVAIDNQNNMLIIEMPVYTLNEIRFIPCSDQIIPQVPELSQALDSTLTISTKSVETNVPPPANAVNRVDNGITIRYFDVDTKDIAEFIRSELKQQDAYQNIPITVENMLPYMPKEIKSYIEIWLKE